MRMVINLITVGTLWVVYHAATHAYICLRLCAFNATLRLVMRKRFRVKQYNVGRYSYVYNSYI